MFNCSLPDFPNLSPSARFSQREASLCFPSTSSLNSEGGGKLRPSFSMDSLPEGFPYQNSLTDEAWELIQFVAARYPPSLLFLPPFPLSFSSLLFSLPLTPSGLPSQELSSSSLAVCRPFQPSQSKWRSARPGQFGWEDCKCLQPRVHQTPEGGLG